MNDKMYINKKISIYYFSMIYDEIEDEEIKNTITALAQKMQYDVDNFTTKSARVKKFNVQEVDLKKLMVTTLRTLRIMEATEIIDVEKSRIDVLINMLRKKYILFLIEENLGSKLHQ